MIINSKLSIIIPVYNGEKHIENTVQSILSSSYRNLELLLVDDGSTDGSLALCRKMAASDSRVKVYHKENGGTADARNYGIAHATGDYIAFCDQDDEISKEMYQKMLARIAADKSQAALCGCYRQKKNGGRVVFEKYADDVFDSQQIEKKLLLPLLFNGFSAYANDEIRIYGNIWKCIISKHLIDDCEMKFRSFVSHEDDLIMLLQLFLHADRISTLSDILYYWNTNPDSEIHNSAKRHLKDLDAKQQNLTAYVADQLAYHGISQNTIEEYTYVQQCRNALLQLDNLAASSERFSLRSIEKLRGCSSIAYIQSALSAIAPQKGFVRNTIIVQMLRKNHIVSAYFLNQMIDSVRLFVEKYHITEKLERRMKETGNSRSAYGQDNY